MAGSFRGEPGGIVRLSNTIDAHRAAFSYDWRARFGLPASGIGESIDWAEANDLATELLLDPSSHVCAAVAGWAYPWSAETFILADLFDAFVATHSKNHPPPRPRPSDPPAAEPVVRVSQARVMAELAKRGHLRAVQEV